MRKQRRTPSTVTDSPAKGADLAAGEERGGAEAARPHGNDQPAATHPRPAAVTTLWTAPLMNADILPQSCPAWE